MKTALSTFVLDHLTPVAVRIEADVRLHGAHLEISGVPEHAARELRVRLLSGLAGSLGLARVGGRITVERYAQGIDLAVAVATLVSLGLAPEPAMSAGLFHAELALDGHLRPVRGSYALGHAIKPAALFVGLEAAHEGALSLVPTFAPRTLSALIQHLTGKQPLAPCVAVREQAQTPAERVPFASHVLETVARAAAARESLMIVAPAGLGPATFLPRFYRSLLEPTADMWDDVAAIHSAAGIFSDGPLSVPFRAPHHTVSEAGLVGANGRPGEVSLAHRGVLWLDALPEFRAAAVGRLRDVLRNGHPHFPAKPCVVATAYPCPCGSYRACRCTTQQRERWADTWKRYELTTRTLVLTEADLALREVGS